MNNQEAHFSVGTWEKRKKTPQNIATWSREETLNEQLNVIALERLNPSFHPADLAMEIIYIIKAIKCYLSLVVLH